jgi:hypothetical protein
VAQRFTSECELCTELLGDYISASNSMVDTKQKLNNRKPASARQLASALLDHALRQRNEARKRLFLHKDRAH